MVPPRTLRLPVVVLSLLALAWLAAEARPRRAEPRWELLGERVVSDEADHDTILVTAAEGVFTSLRLRVFERPVEFRRVVVHFRNGEEQELELRSVVPAGGTTRAIDLAGNRRVIHSVEFWYDAQAAASGRAVVRLFGRH
jgi:hypothetical protein